MIVFGVVLSLTVVGTSFLIWRRWRCLQVTNCKRRTEQQQGVGLPDGGANAINKSEETEQTSFFELRSAEAAQGQSTTERHHRQFQPTTKSRKYENAMEGNRDGVYIYEEVRQAGGII